MPSPFPGMDPYLEAFWRDVQTALMIYARDAIQEQLPGDLFARIEEGVSIDTDEGSRTISPDVHVAESPQAAWRPALTGGSTAVAAPVIVPVDEPFTERHIQIIDSSSGGRVVTAIEFLSPTNKIPAGGREKYVQKQREYLDAGVNLVEVDLIRSGIFTLAVPLANVPASARSGYYVCVRHSARPAEAMVYGLPLREPLPIIPVPLRPTDHDVTLDLQQIVTLAYDRGRYAATIDYSVDPDPPLGPVDARWADELLQAAGKR